MLVSSTVAHILVVSKTVVCFRNDVPVTEPRVKDLTLSAVRENAISTESILYPALPKKATTTELRYSVSRSRDAPLVT